jgi:hypothetical protein
MTYAAVVVRVNVLRDFTYPGEATPLDVVNVHGAVGGEAIPEWPGVLPELWRVSQIRWRV